MRRGLGGGHQRVPQLHALRPRQVQVGVLQEELEELQVHAQVLQEANRVISELFMFCKWVPFDMEFQWNRFDKYTSWCVYFPSM